MVCSLKILAYAGASFAPMAVQVGRLGHQCLADLDYFLLLHY